MSIIEKIRSLVISESGARSAECDGTLKSKGLFGLADMSESGISVTTNMAMRLTGVYQAIRILSELPASLPIEVIEENGRNRSPVESHPIKDLLAVHPNKYMNRFTFHELMNANMQAKGNGIGVIMSWRGSYPDAIIPIPSDDVTVKLHNNEIFYVVDSVDIGIKQTYFRDEVIHYKNFGLDTIWSRSPIAVARDALGHALATESFGSRYFKQGGNLKAVLETEGHMDDDTFKNWKKRWEANYEGPAGDHRTPVLEFGMKYKPVSISAEDAQFILSRQFNIQEIARIFNIPPHLLMDLSRATFSNIEHQDLQFVKYCLRPIIRRQEMELEDKLLLPSERGRIRIRFNLDGMLRGDTASVTSHVKEMVQVGVITPNEGRHLFNRNPLPGLDEPLNPANITGKEKEPIDSKSVHRELIQNISSNGKE